LVGLDSVEEARLMSEEEIAELWSREMRKGYAKLTALLFLSRKPMTGYDIMREIETRTLGFWRLTPGGVYPALKELEKKGCIEARWEAKGERKKKIYEITDEGKRILEAALNKQQQMAETLRELLRQFAHEILGTKLPATPKTLELLPFARLEEKPIDEQIRVLKEARERMSMAIKLIDERLESLQRSK
jgi:DNA-binding PadR family transcriptional regulator